jgi:hypothetical protein
MAEFIHSFQTALRERPWTFSDISNGYLYGKWIVSPFTGGKGLNSVEIYGYTFDAPFLILGVKVLDTAFLMWEKSSDHRTALLQRRLDYCILALGAAGAVYLVYKNLIEQPLSNKGIAGTEIVPYASKALAIANIAQILIAAQEKPHRVLAVGISGVITLLDETNKLPKLVSQVWSYMPLVSDCITIYEGDLMFKSMAAHSIFERDIKPYLFPKK